MERSRSNAEQERERKCQLNPSVGPPRIDVAWRGPGPQEAALEPNSELGSGPSIINSRADPSGHAKRELRSGPADPCRGGGPPITARRGLYQYAALERELLRA